MTVSLSATASELEKMKSLLNHVVNLSKQLSGINDGPHLREQIQFDVRALSASSQTVKQNLFQLKQQNESGADPLLERFEALRARMQEELPPVVQKLRGNPTASTPLTSSGVTSGYTDPLLAQAELDNESEVLDVLEQQVHEILASMREVSRLFAQTLEEFKKQRHILVAIEAETLKAVEDMEVGNEELRKGQNRQRCSTKCICWIVVILIVVVAAIALIIVWKVKWSKQSENAPSRAEVLSGIYE
jgi:hypothetical protein